jgi:hypothetical protein
LVESDPDGTADSSSASLGRSWLFEARGIATILLPGVYAWGATVAWPAFSVRGASPVARFAAAGALIALLVGPLVARKNLLLGRALGVLAFVGCAAAAWGALGTQLREQLDPVRAALGALGWGLFALGWGTFPGRTRLPEDDPHAVLATRLPPRARLPAATSVAFGMLLVAGLGLPLLAWRVERAGVALLAHAVALAGSVALLSIGTRVLLAPPSGGARRPRLGVLVLLIWLAVGVVVWLL